MMMNKNIMRNTNKPGTLNVKDFGPLFEHKGCLNMPPDIHITYAALKLVGNNVGPMHEFFFFFFACLSNLNVSDNQTNSNIRKR